MSETRLRIIVACGAAGGIAATFNAPITGLFFGFEIILREFSLDALFATILSAVTADLVSRAFFGSAPFFAQIPHDLAVTHDSTYLLIALLGVWRGARRLRVQDRSCTSSRTSPTGSGRVAGVGPARGRRPGARRAAARSSPDVRRRLPGDGQGHLRAHGPVALGRAHGGQGRRHQPHPLHRRLGRGLRPVAVHRGDGRDGLRGDRPPPLRRRS